jgi:hypothetical protein
MIKTLHAALPPGSAVVPTMRERLHSRTCYNAAKAGRLSTSVSQADYEQAKRDVTGETDPDRQTAILDA